MNQAPAGAPATNAESGLDNWVEAALSTANPTTSAPCSSIPTCSAATSATFTAGPSNNSTSSIADHTTFASSANNPAFFVTDPSTRIRVGFDSDPAFRDHPLLPSPRRQTSPAEDYTLFETSSRSSIHTDRSASEDHSTNPAYSTVVVDDTTSYYIPRLVPGASVTAANQTSRYQQFINFIPDGCLECTHRLHDLRHCEKAWLPLRDFETVEPLICLNCGWLGHSVFGCPCPLAGAIILWHYSPPQLGQERYPPKIGVVELAKDIKPGCYDIPFALWRQLAQIQVRPHLL